MKDLRKCKIKNENGLFYFHKWIEEGDVKLHPENPQYDRPYIETLALIENVDTGEVVAIRPRFIIFVNEQTKTENK